MKTRNNHEKRKLKVILDSNALFAPLQFKIDIFEELKNLLKANFEPILLSINRRELEKLAKSGAPSIRRKASYALQLAHKCHVIEVNDEFTSPDEAIIEFARTWKCPVFTNDKMLRKKLRDISVPVVYVRQKSRLGVDGRITPCLNSSRYKTLSAFHPKLSENL